MNHFYVYIIYSSTFDKYYKGFSENPKRRLIQHNLGESLYTKNYTPWNLIHVESYATKKEALIREKKIKKYSKTQIKDLVKSKVNILGQI